jgi:Na+-driven multidrug efflux pump
VSADQDRDLDRRIWALAIPALGSIAAEPLYNLVDTAIVGHLGRQQLAALAFVLDGLILGISDYRAMRRAMLLSILPYAPMAALVLRFHGLGLPGIWIALGLWLAARSALLGRRWQSPPMIMGRKRPNTGRNYP